MYLSFFYQKIQQYRKSTALNNAAWLLAERGLILGSSFIFTIVLTRYWTVAQLGEYQYLLALVALLIPFSSLGLNSLISRELVTRHSSVDSIMGTAIILRLLGALFGAIVFSLLAFWLVSPELQPLFWVLLCAQLTHALGAIDYYFEAKVLSKVSAVIRTCVGLGFMAIKLAYVIKGATLPTVLILTIIEWGILGISWLLVYQIYQGGLRHLCWCTEQAKHYLSRCGWLLLSSFAAVIYLKIDQIMLGMMQSSDEVAFYSLASRLSEVWYIVPGILVASFYPALIKLKQDDNADAYPRMLQTMCNYLCWGSITIAVLISVVASSLVPFLFGESYLPVISILQIHIWAGVFIFMRALFSKWLLIEDIPKYSLVTHGCGAVINLILNMVFIPHYGAEGAAWATLVSYAAASYLGVFIFVKTRSMGIIMSRALVAPFRAVYCYFR